MKNTQKFVLAFITAIGIGATAYSYATGMGMGPGECAMAGKKMANSDQIDSHLATMKKEMRIGSEQEEAWSGFAKTIKQQKTEMMSAMQAWKRPVPSVQPVQSAPDRIGERIQFMKQRVAGMETVAIAMKQLNGVLTPEQKKILNGHFDLEMPM